MNTNGVISFLGPLPQHESDPFPLDGKTVIAPYWGDVDTRNGGDNSYRELLRTDSQQGDIFQLADEVIHEAFVNQRKFQSKWMFIATWNQVGFFGSSAREIVS